VSRAGAEHRPGQCGRFLSPEHHRDFHWPACEHGGNELVACWLLPPSPRDRARVLRQQPAHVRIDLPTDVTASAGIRTALHARSHARRRCKVSTDIGPGPLRRSSAASSDRPWREQQAVLSAPRSSRRAPATIAASRARPTAGSPGIPDLRASMCAQGRSSLHNGRYEPAAQLPIAFMSWVVLSLAGSSPAASSPVGP
jgi:hypothetical protein